jgi:hypothetical protein
MKKINNRWYDENNNSWSAHYETEESARIKSDSLRNCSNCYDCSDFKTNPQRYVTGKIGSRNAQTTFYWNEELNQVICGCFNGTLEEIEARVKAVHKNNEQHLNEYLKEIDKVKYLMN